MKDAGSFSLPISKESESAFRTQVASIRVKQNSRRHPALPPSVSISHYATSINVQKCLNKLKIYSIRVDHERKTIIACVKL